MTERMHPQDLRAIVGAIFGAALPSQGITARAINGLAIADALLERTAPKETPVTAKPAPIPTVTVCPACHAQAREGEALVHAQGCRVPYFGAFPDLPAPTRTCTHVDETAPVPEDGKRDLRRSILCRIPAGELEDLRAEVDRLKAEAAQARDFRFNYLAADIAKAQAEAAREERERIIALLSRHPFYVMDGPNHIIEGQRLRAALEPKPEVPRG